MKDLKKINEEKLLLISKEMDQCIIKYVSEADKIIPDYNYDETRKMVDALNQKEIYLRGLLLKANATVIVPEFNMTIGACLIYLAQLEDKARTLKVLSSKQPKTRTLQFQKQVEYSEAIYDIEVAKKDYDEVKEEITKLQMAIDRINLTNLIEV